MIIKLLTENDMEKYIDLMYQLNQYKQKKINPNFDFIYNGEYRKRGYSKKLITFLLDKAKEENCYKVILNCKIELKKFYENCGMIQEGIFFSKRF